MGSQASTPVNENPEDPWWPVLENQPFNLHVNGQTIGESNQNQSIEQQPVNNQNRGSVTVIIDDSEIEATMDDEKSISMADEKATTTTKTQTLEEFKEELRIKREKRQGAIADLRNEMKTLRQRLTSEQLVNNKLREIIKRGYIPLDESELIFTNVPDYNSIETQTDEVIEELPDVDAPTFEDVELIKSKNTELQSQLADVQLALQLANADVLSLTSELNVTRKQANSLKEVVKVTKQMLELREQQVNQLKSKLREIEDSLGDHEMKIMSAQLRKEYDRQLENIQNLRTLYEERSRVNAAEKENLTRQLETKTSELEFEVEKTKNLESRLAELESNLEETTTKLDNTKYELDKCASNNHQLEQHMTVVNQLFTQLLVGFQRKKDINIDKLTEILVENRDILQEMTHREEKVENAVELPKLFFDLVSQASIENEKEESGTSESAIKNDVNDEESSNEDEEVNTASAADIVLNLPKVWRVLSELLSHQDEVVEVPLIENGRSEDCFNSVETPKGTELVLSVSKTFIKLKDLILEKKSLQKETNKLKNLNNHLEQRLGAQEKRLGLVSLELTKTWHLVSKMQRQHRQLHTQEQVLRYQLQQKRRILTELKEELEMCRRKWSLAKEKNIESESQWQLLRKEFNSRKKSQEGMTSAESGYSDGVTSDIDSSSSDDEGSEKSSQRKQKPAKHVLPRNLSNPGSTAIAEVIEISEEGEIAQQMPVKLESHICENECYCTIGSIVPEVLQETDSISISAATTSALPAASSSTSSAVASSTVLPSAAQKVVAKNTGTKPRLCSEIRKKGAATKPSNNEESLENMFLRLSSDNSPSTSRSSDMKSDEKRKNREIRYERLETQCKELIKHVLQHSNVSVTPLRGQLNIIDEVEASGSSDQSEPVKLTAAEEEYTRRRAERIKRLEDECNKLMKKVEKASSKGDQMNSQIDDLHKRFSTDASKETSKENSIDTDVSKENESNDVIDNDSIETEGAMSLPLPSESDQGKNETDFN